LQSIDLEDDSVIDLIAHSQGCVVAALARSENVRNVIFIAPPSNLDADSMVAYFGSRDGATIDVNGESVIPRRDGSRTIINASYWSSIRSLNVIGLYNKLASVTKLTFYIADNDEVLGPANFDGTDPNIDLIDVEGDHDFKDAYRDNLCQLVAGRLILS